MATPSDSNFKGPVSHDATGYNGQTGAPAKWDPSKSMWIDSNGVEIRDDAITATPGNSGGGTPAAAPTTGGGGGGAAMDGLRGAMTPTPVAPTITNMGTPAEANPNLGSRNVPIDALKLALRQQQFGRVY